MSSHKIAPEYGKHSRQVPCESGGQSLGRSVGSPAARHAHVISSASSKEIIVPAPSKRPSKPPATARVKRVVKASSPSPLPFLRFYHSESLRAKTLAVLTALEKA